MLFALAGLAEAAIVAEQMLMTLGLFLVAIFALLGLFLRKDLAEGATVLCLCGVVALSMVFRPWEWFTPPTSDDHDMLSFQYGYRDLAWLWVTVTILALAALARAYVRQSPQVESPDPESRA